MEFIKIKNLCSFMYLIINKTSLYLAVENENIEIIKLLLSNDKVDPNIPTIFNFVSFIKFNKQ